MKWLRWSVPAAASLVLGFYIVTWSLITKDYFEDDAYNQAVLRHSALPTATHWLETSCATSFFEVKSIPHPEDWHRGLSMFIAAGWLKMLGGRQSMLEHVPHVLWVAAWLGLVVALVTVTSRTLARDRGSFPPRYGLDLFWASVAAITILCFNPWGFKIINHAFLDDVPAAVCVLTGVLLLFRGDSTIRSQRMAKGAAAGFGVLCGLGFWMKDFYLLWGPTGAVFLLVVLAAQQRDKESQEDASNSTSKGNDLPVRDKFRIPWTEVLLPWGARLGLYCLGFAGAMAAKMTWSYFDLGGAMENPAKYGAGCHFCASRPIDENFPFFLYGSKAYLSKTAMAGSLSNVFSQAATRAGCYCYMALCQLRPWWLLLLPSLGLIYGRRATLSWRGRALLLLVMLTWAIYCAFFLLALGIAFELRYWIVPVTLTVVLAVSCLLDAYRGWNESRRDSGVRPLRGQSLWLGITASVLLIHTGLLEPSLVFLRDGRIPPHGPDAMSIARAVQGNEPNSILIACWSAHAYYRDHPESRVVAFSSYHLPDLNREQLNRLCDTYRITCALFSLDDPSVEYLKRMGFCERFRIGKDVVLIRNDG